MTSDIRIQILRFAGWLVFGCGVLVIVSDFVDSERTWRDFRSALRDGSSIVILGSLFLVLSGIHGRIHQLEVENARLRSNRSSSPPH
jgi:hypothetical protein